MNAEWPKLQHSAFIIQTSSFKMWLVPHWFNGVEENRMKRITRMGNIATLGSAHAASRFLGDA